MAAALEQIRGDREWQEVALQLDVSPSAISKLLHGERTASTDLILQFDDRHPGFMTILLRFYARIQKTGIATSGRTKAGRAQALAQAQKTEDR